ncbi:MurR/RpiR family transcriptional regulator [Chromobacterium haemolyticum]|nr:MurR/RpiR family transcriptional regulator [Chromobacterium haemolyticum]
MSQSRSIAEQVRALFEALTPTERKVGRALLANYPVAGLETIAQWAQRADVSGPTVLRLIGKLGFDNYAAFQGALRAELELRLQSPLMRHDPGQLQGDHDFLASHAERIADLMRQTAAQVPRAEFDGAVDLLGERKHRIWLLGGRLTDPLAAYLCHHLKVVRPDVVHLRGVPASWADSLVDMGRQDVLVIFDIRRYWDDALRIAEMAAQRKTQRAAVHRPMAVAGGAGGALHPGGAHGRPGRLGQQHTVDDVGGRGDRRLERAALGPHQRPAQGGGSDAGAAGRRRGGAVE